MTSFVGGNGEGETVSRGLDAREPVVLNTGALGEVLYWD